MHRIPAGLQNWRKEIIPSWGSTGCWALAFVVSHHWNMGTSWQISPRYFPNTWNGSRWQSSPLSWRMQGWGTGQAESYEQHVVLFPPSITPKAPQKSRPPPPTAGNVCMPITSIMKNLLPLKSTKTALLQIIRLISGILHFKGFSIFKKKFLLNSILNIFFRVNSLFRT